MNLPNKLTVARIIATPVFMAFMLIPFKYSYLVALIIFILASLTDWLDGKIARKYNLITDFGKFLDPIADKMLTTAALIGFAYKQVGFGIAWIMFIVLFREFLIASLRMVAASSSKAKVVAANFWGKAKTVSQMVAIIFVLAAEQVKVFVGEGALANALDISGDALLWISAVLCIVSGVIYVIDNKEFVNTSK